MIFKNKRTEMFITITAITIINFLLWGVVIGIGYLISKIVGF